jgi:HD-GYP domain-containing protein (c-di-GMP phosphodiesterase class II)
MNPSSQTDARERLIAGLLLFLGLCSLAYSVFTTKISENSWLQFWLAILLGGAIVIADHFPIHIARGTKASLVNLPVFLSAVLLPAPFAIAATGLGLLAADFLARGERGLLPRDLASTSGQWMFMTFVGYQIVHFTIPALANPASRFGLLLLCALAYLLLDFLIFSLSQSFAFHEPFLATLKSVVREGFVLELIQYLLAILGALAADEDIRALVLLIVPVSITYVAFKNIKEIHRETVQILEDTADTVDLRDIYTGGHSKRVADLVHQMLTELKISGPEAILIETAARLHDIGKIGIPDQILTKPGALLPEEMDVMRTHSKKGAELIAKYKDFSRGALMILHHHERWDGQGYPFRLKGPEIPFGARVIAVADSFDAMTSDRPYRNALSNEQAIETLLQGQGTQWDPHVVEAFVDMIRNQLNEEQKAADSVHIVSFEELRTSALSSH